jgi:cellulose synthase/poly-beta-1,6-N-acetylglucosamine synthase-like glycosyltransferase
MMLLILLLALCYWLFVLWLLRGWQSLPELSEEEIEQWPPVSVVVCMRNESHHIIQCLQCLVAQQYPPDRFEIIVADDFSEDDSVHKAEVFAAGEQRIKITVLKATTDRRPGKKYALAAAVSHSSRSVIALTDADCTMSDQWLTTMVIHHVRSRAEVSAGPVTLTGDSFFQRMQQLEFMSLSGITAATLALNKPMMINAANMVFNREAFIRAGRLHPTEKATSGDDTYFMLTVAEKNPGSIAFVKSIHAMVFTPSASTLRDFFRQRIRWVSKTRHYPWLYIRLTGISVFAFNFFLLLLCLLSLFFHSLLIPALVLFVLKIMAENHLLNVLNRFYRLPDSLPVKLMVFVIYPLYLSLVAWLSLRTNHFWKGRRVPN